MEEYPEEFRTPPLPLVAFIGLPEFHLQVTHYLRAEQPPLATVSIPDAIGAASLAGKERRPPDAKLPSPLGVLKAGWLAKHRQKAASVAVAFFPREKIFGDPNQWLSVCTQIDAIKAAIRGRNIKVVVAIAQANAAPLDASEERLQALRKRVETEARCCVPFVTGDVAQLRTSLANLAKLVGELAATFYREEGRRIKTRVEKKAYSSPEFSVRYNFKIAVYAEFRRDWVAAVKYYNAAYTLLHEVPTPPQELQPVQRLVEAKSVAEILHLKLVTLLLHSGNTLEAVTQLRRHLAWYRAREGPPEGAFLHWAWVSKQYKVFGELLQSRLAVAGEKPTGGVVAAVTAAVTASAGGGEREQQPAFYFQLAAACAVKRRQAFESALSIAQAFGDLEQEDVLSGVAEKIGPPLYIGQAPRILNRGLTPETQRPTEAEFVRHALLQERHVAHSQLAIALLTRAHDQYKRMPHAGRIIYQLGGEMADEYLHANDLSNARRLYDSVAAVYRKESWALLLAATLERLRECTRQGGLVQAFVEYSLELASLPLNGGNGGGNGYESTSWDGGKGIELRKHAQGEAMAILAGSGLKLDRIDSGVEEEEAEKKPAEALAIDPAAPVLLSFADASPLRTVLSCTALFEQRSAQPGTPTKLTVALLSRLPSALSPTSIEVVFSDPACNVTLTSSQPVVNLMDDTSAAPTKESVRSPEELTLNSLEWRKLSVDVTPKTSGRLECQAVILTLGANSRLRCQVESLVGGEILVPFWMYEPRGEGSPKPVIPLGGLHVLEVGEAPADVDVQVEFGGEPGLVGEVLPVRILVSSRGDKVSGGKLSLEPESLAPKPPAAVSDASLVDLGSEVPVVEVLPAELLVNKGSEGAERESADVTAAGAADMATSGTETAESSGSGAYEKFSGQLAVPEIDAGGEWAAVVFLRWAQAADAGLAVTVSYEAEKGGGAPRKSKVRKVVPMRGEEPLSVSHRWFAPFRKDALLPSPSTASAKLPLNEEVLLSVSVRSSSSVPVRVSGLALRMEQNLAEEVGTAGQSSQADLLADSAEGKENGVRDLGPGEAFSKLFRVRPLQPGESVSLGVLEVTWQRHVEVPAGTWDTHPAPVVSVLPLAPVSVEGSHVLVETELPACATLGKPFSVAVRITNATELLQEVAFSVTDSPSFVLGGSHNGQMIVLPRSVKALLYELVPIQAGLLTLPQIKFSTVRHGAKLNPTQGNAKIFVYPSSTTEGSGQNAVGNGVSVEVR